MRTFIYNLTKRLIHDVQYVYDFRPSRLSLFGEESVDSTLSRPSEAENGSLTPEANRPENMGAGAGAGPPLAPAKETLETILLALDAEK